MKKLILVILSIVLASELMAQVDTTRPLTVVSGVGYVWNQGEFRYKVKLPNDTFRLKMADSGSIANKNGILYKWNGFKWLQIFSGSGGTGTVTNVNTGYGLLGGPITSSGNIEADTSALATKYDLTLKQDILQADLPLLIDSNVISIPMASLSTDGYLSATDYTDFYNKDTSKWAYNGADIYNKNGGNVGIGTSNPTKKLEIFGGDALINGLTVGRGGNGSNIRNVAIGNNALLVNTSTAHANIAIGPNVLSSLTTGISNVAIGYLSQLNNINGSANVAIGSNSMANHNTGFYNTAIGYEAMTSISTGSNNVAIGRNATSNLSGTFSGSNNTHVGASGGKVLAGSDNVSLGSFANVVNPDSSNQLAIGNITGRWISGKNGNIGIGVDVPDSLLTVNKGLLVFRGVRFSGLPTSVGTKALRIDSSGNLSIADTTVGGGGGGSSSLTVGTTSITSGTTGRLLYQGTTGLLSQTDNLIYDTTTSQFKVVGNMRLTQSATVNNILIGGGNLTATGTNNVGVGVSNLSSLTSGTNNYAGGFEALKNVADGSSNMALGTQSLYSIVDGVYNVGIGTQAAYNQTNAPNNIAIGRMALYNNVSGNGNTAIGTFALQNTTGNFNTAFGLYSGQNLTTGGYNVAIGSWLDFPSTTASGQLNIGNVLYGTGMYATSVSSSTPISGGKIGIGLTNPTKELDVAGSGNFSGNLTAANLTSGTYTPSVTNVANITAATPYQCQYLRVGNTVTVSGQIDIDPNLTATSTELRISLPITSNIAASQNLGGTGFCQSVTGLGLGISGDATNDAASFKFSSSDINNNTFNFTFTYTIL